MKSGRTGKDSITDNDQYVESLPNGSCFSFAESYLIVTSDHRSNADRMCVDLKTGGIRWIKPSVMVEKINIFTFDKDTNIISIKDKEII